jgi:hypothetical protein
MPVLEDLEALHPDYCHSSLASAASCLIQLAALEALNPSIQILHVPEEIPIGHLERLNGALGFELLG